MRSASLSLLGCLLALACLPQAALATQFYCDGQVTSLGLNDGTGRLWIAYGSLGIQTICDVDGAAVGIGANTCKAWMALLAAAQAQQKTIRIYYDSTTSGNPTSCAGFATWGTYHPYFFHTLD